MATALGKVLLSQVKMKASKVEVTRIMIPEHSPRELPNLGG